MNLACTNEENPLDVISVAAGRWVSEAVYAERHALAKQTLTNWRYRDHLAGRTQALPGFPVYRRFGRAIRYWLEPEGGRS